MLRENGGPVNDASHELVEIPTRHRNVLSSMTAHRAVLHTHVLVCVCVRLWAFRNTKSLCTVKVRYRTSSALKRYPTVYQYRVLQYGSYPLVHDTE